MKRFPNRFLLFILILLVYSVFFLLERFEWVTLRSDACELTKAGDESLDDLVVDVSSVPFTSHARFFIANGGTNSVVLYVQDQDGARRCSPIRVKSGSTVSFDFPLRSKLIVGVRCKGVISGAILVKPRSNESFSLILAALITLLTYLIQKAIEERTKAEALVSKAKDDVQMKLMQLWGTIRAKPDRNVQEWEEENVKSFHSMLIEIRACAKEFSKDQELLRFLKSHLQSLRHSYYVKPSYSEIDSMERDVMRLGESE